MENQVEEKKRKDGTLIIRVSNEERAIIDKKVEAAGYKSASAYVRDYIAREAPRQKAEISPDSLRITRELMALSSLVNSDSEKSKILTKISEIAVMAMGR